jgi:dephospho-CoA kinase
MIVIGLTGGIGMGKSTSASLLEQQGVRVVDTDDLARRVVEPGQPALEEIRQAFGENVIAADGGLRRKQLAETVFADDVKRRRLEAILHPKIRELWLAQVRSWRDQQVPIGVVVIPLLFETDAAAQFDSVICVACSSATQRKRLLARGWSNEQIQQRMAAQWPVQKKIDLSNYVVWTEPDQQTHAAQLKRILERLENRQV